MLVLKHYLLFIWNLKGSGHPPGSLAILFLAMCNSQLGDSSLGLRGRLSELFLCCKRYPVCCGMFTSISSFYPRDASRIAPASIGTTEYVSRYCQTSRGMGHHHPYWRTTALEVVAEAGLWSMSRCRQNVALNTGLNCVGPLLCGFFPPNKYSAVL